jgi:hypothetical protein
MNMKSRKSLIFLSALLVISFGAGLLTQKYMAIGNIVRIINPDYRKKKIVEVIKKEHQGNLSLFILAGQSNMEGDGDISDYTPIVRNEAIYVFNDDFKWEKGREPVRKGVGPSISFAVEIIKHRPEKKIGIINIAVGSTNIHQWRKSLSDNSLYQRMLKRAFSA